MVGRGKVGGKRERDHRERAIDMYINLQIHTDKYGYLLLARTRARAHTHTHIHTHIYVHAPADTYR